jgi:hypothetical protein
MLSKTKLNKMTERIMNSLKRGGYLKKLGPLMQETLEEDFYELLEKWRRVL